MQNSSAPKLVLASKSPARQALLRQAGLAFSVAVAPVDERALEAGLKGHRPADLAAHLAAEKARAVSRTEQDAFVIGADQVLDLEGEVLHKPADLAAAAERLRALSGRTHTLISAVALLRGGQTLFSALGVARLTMHRLTDAEIETVLALEGPAILSSVGAYRLEGPSVRLFSAISGDYFTILGLPLLELIGALRQHAPALLATKE